jgi:hypothetical protein
LEAGHDGRFTLSASGLAGVPDAWGVFLVDTKGTTDPADDEIADLRAGEELSLSLGATSAVTSAADASTLNAFLPSFQPRPLPTAKGSIDRYVLRIDATGEQLVELGPLQARPQADGVLVEWTTVSETNNTGFWVQRRIENGSFEDLGFVESSVGTTTEPQSYSYLASGLDVGTHTFRLRQVSLDGLSTVVGEVTAQLRLEEPYDLRAPYPNPVRDRSTVEFVVQEAQHVTVAVYDALGRRVATLFDGPATPHEVEALAFESQGLASGVYFVRARGEQFAATQRLTVVR